jgi:hypothetical protein
MPHFRIWVAFPLGINDANPVNITEQLSNETVDDSKCDQLELALKCKLPHSYREFLKKYNGGRPAPSAFRLVTKDGKHENSTVQCFFAVYEGRTGNLLRKFDLYKGRIPTGQLPIATDPFGNLILIPMLDLPDVPVYFWDHEKELTVKSTFDNVSLIAESFEKFINDLH